MLVKTLIDSDAELGELVEALSRAPLAAVDTEFIRENTYYPRLCLMQVATEELGACVDCVAGLDLAPLFEALSRADCVWVAHSARQDLEVFQHYARTRPGGLIDTQVAAGLAGRPPQIGLQDILSEMLAVELGKGYTRTDWSRRPLPEGALNYALDDVRYLLPLWQRLERELRELDRLHWLAEDSGRLLEEAEGGDLLPIWGRLKGVQTLPADVQAAALALIRWRETTARGLDRPRRWIMSDELLGLIAQVRPGTVGELGALAEMPRRLASRAGTRIVAALDDRDAPELAAVLERAASTVQPDKEALKALQARVKERAAVLGIQPEVLATRRDLIAFLVGSAPQRLRTGWRAAEIEPLFAGHDSGG